MTNKRKQYNPQFKAKIALEAIRGEKTVAQLAAQYSLHPTVINNWKRQLLAGASEDEDSLLRQSENDAMAAAARASGQS